MLGEGPGDEVGGVYVLQATIACLHTGERSDWERIAACYRRLLELTGSPVVRLNRAVAVAESRGPQAGLEELDGLALDGYLYLHSTRAELLRRLDRAEEARAAYERALGLVRSDPERRFLERRLDEL